jgi:tripartite-type tricarboxylate transporter receptor subunit TctC
LFFFAASFTATPALHAKLPFDSQRDFAPITLLSAFPNLLVVHPSLPVKSVQDLLALARARPGQLNYGTSGAATGTHMSMELFKLMTGTKITHVPYKGAGPGMTALLAGEVNMMFNGQSAALPQVKAGRLRALAVGGDKRSALLPELPCPYFVHAWCAVRLPGQNWSNRPPRCAANRRHQTG